MADIANFLAQNSPRFQRAGMDRGIYENALLKNDVQRLPQRNAAEDVAIKNEQQAFTDNRQVGARRFVAEGMAGIGQAQDPLGTARSIIANPTFQSALRDAGFDPAQFTITAEDTPESIKQQSLDIARAMGAQFEQSDRYTVVDGPDGSKFSVNQGTGQYTTLLGREPQQPTPANAAARYRTLTPEEVKLAGLPPGSSAQLNEGTGQISILNKADTAGGPATQRPTEAMNKAAGLVSRMRTLSADVINTAPAVTTQVLARIAQGGGITGAMANTQLSAAEQKHFNAARGWLAGVLRQDTGATIQPFEIQEYYPTFFPVPGDTPQVIEQKRQLRETTERQMEEGAGNALVGGGLPPIIPNSSPGQMGQAGAPTGVVSWDQL